MARHLPMRAMVTFDSHIPSAPLDDGSLLPSNHLPLPTPAAHGHVLQKPPLRPQAASHGLTAGRLPAANTSLDCLDDVDCFDW